MTEEKTQAIGAGVDPVVLGIKTYSDENPRVSLFEMKTFEELFSKHHVKRSIWQHILNSINKGIYLFGNF
mgnify:FL=1